MISGSAGQDTLFGDAGDDKITGDGPATLGYVDSVPAGHAFIAPAFGNLCETNGSPYIGHCQVRGGSYDQPRAILEHIYGPLKPAAATLSASIAPFFNASMQAE